MLSCGSASPPFACFVPFCGSLNHQFVTDAVDGLEMFGFAALVAECALRHRDGGPGPALKQGMMRELLGATIRLM